MSSGSSYRFAPNAASLLLFVLVPATAPMAVAVESPGEKNVAKSDTIEVVGLPEKNLIFTVDHLSMATAALGPEWDVRTPAERTEFVELMSDLIKQAYDRLKSRVRGCRVEMTGTEMRPDGQVIRKFTARSLGAESDSMEFTLTFTSEEKQWFLKDFSTDGVSLVRVYRSQFLKILKNEGFAALIQKMKAKVEKDRTTDTAPR